MGEHPQAHLRNAIGILRADAYAGFRKFYERGIGAEPRTTSRTRGHARGTQDTRPRTMGFPCFADGSSGGVGYSTVTDFARLRGWSTSVPLRMAVW